MILRFIVENIASFKEAVEFNTFPSSKSHSHENHKMPCGHAVALRMGAIYGANGAGKSNLLVALDLLKGLVETESLVNFIIYDDLVFKFDREYVDKPSGMAIEFYHNDNVFYYHIEFNRKQVFLEELYLSKRTKDVKLFVRENSSIDINGDYFGKGFNPQFVDVLDRLVRPDMLFLSFMGKYYPGEMPLVNDAYHWFMDRLQVVLPDSYAVWCHTCSIQTVVSQSWLILLCRSLRPEFLGWRCVRKFLMRKIRKVTIKCCD